jgi:hypothetical protein
MSKGKQYRFYCRGRKAYDGTVYPNYESGTYKTVRKAEQAMHEFDALPGVSCGGSYHTEIRRVR